MCLLLDYNEGIIEFIFATADRQLSSAIFTGQAIANEGRLKNIFTYLRACFTYILSCTKNIDKEFHN